MKKVVLKFGIEIVEETSQALNIFHKFNYIVCCFISNSNISIMPTLVSKEYSNFSKSFFVTTHLIFLFCLHFLSLLPLNQKNITSKNTMVQFCLIDLNWFDLIDFLNIKMYFIYLLKRSNDTHNYFS